MAAEPQGRRNFTRADPDTLTDDECLIADALIRRLEARRDGEAHDVGIDGRAGELLTPSAIARMIGEDVVHVRNVLEYLARHRDYIRDGGGSYGIRKFGLIP